MADLSWPIHLGDEPNRINIVNAIEGLTFDEAWSSRVTARYAGATVSFIGRAALLRHCDAAGGFADAELLRRFL